MTRRDYVLLARSIRRTREHYLNDPPALLAINELMLGIAADIGASNPLFDRERFLTAIRTGKGI